MIPGVARRTAVRNNPVRSLNDRAAPLHLDTEGLQ
jgi:hypothetical protein